MSGIDEIWPGRREDLTDEEARSARDLLTDPAMRKLYLGAEIEPAA